MSSTGSTWYYVERGERAGPHTLGEMRTLLADGGIDPETLVWSTGMAQWLPAERLPILFEAAPEEEAEAPPPVPVVQEPAAELPAAAHAWSRFLARSLDVGISGLLVLLVAGVDVQTLRPDEIPLMLQLLGPGLWVPMEALLLAVLGTTPGKALFNLRVETREGVRPSPGVALSRAVRVWVQGTALGIPLPMLLTEAIGYTRLTRTGSTFWDDALALQVSQGRIGPVRALILAALMVFFAIGLGGALQALSAG
jgi:hypothetical protein